MNKEPGFDLQKQIVEEVNRVLENRLAAKEETEALKKELDKAPFDGLTQEIRDLWWQSAFHPGKVPMAFFLKVSFFLGESKTSGIFCGFGWWFLWKANRKPPLSHQTTKWGS